MFVKATHEIGNLKIVLQDWGTFEVFKVHVDKSCDDAALEKYMKFHKDFVVQREETQRRIVLLYRIDYDIKMFHFMEKLTEMHESLGEKYKKCLIFTALICPNQILKAGILAASKKAVRPVFVISSEEELQDLATEHA